MKKILLPLLLLFSLNSLFAQPSNDDCATLIDLGVIPFCPDSVSYTNVDALETDIGELPGGTLHGNRVGCPFLMVYGVLRYPLFYRGVQSVGEGNSSTFQKVHFIFN